LLGYEAIPDDLNDPKECKNVKMSDDESCEDLAKVAKSNDPPLITQPDDIIGTSCKKSQSIDTVEQKKPTFDEKNFEQNPEVVCSRSRRYCALYGVHPIVCICETDPVEGIDLETVRTYCWFATTSVDKMSNSWKRNMLYWWYMTNHYSIAGRGRRLEPPRCLMYAIRNAYPEKDGLYKKFNIGSKLKSGHRANKKRLEI
jgi:hypothetical protein